MSNRGRNIKCNHGSKALVGLVCTADNYVARPCLRLGLLDVRPQPVMPQGMQHVKQDLRIITGGDLQTALWKQGPS